MWKEAHCIEFHLMFIGIWIGCCTGFAENTVWWDISKVLPTSEISGRLWKSQHQSSQFNMIPVQQHFSVSVEGVSGEL